MTILDFVLIIILFFFTFSGFWFGLIHTFGALVGTIAGVLVAGHYFETGASLISPIFMGNTNLAKIVAFILIFIIVNRLVGLVFWVINKLFNVIAIIPFLKTINRLAGAVLGFLEGSLVLGVVIIMIGKFPFANFIIPAIDVSKVAKYLISVGKVLMPLLPEIVKHAQSFIK